MKTIDYFPYLLYKDMIEGRAEPVIDFKEGIKFVHIYADFRVVITEIKRGI